MEFSAEMGIKHHVSRAQALQPDLPGSVHSPAAYQLSVLWTNYLTSLGLCFPIYKTLVPASQGFVNVYTSGIGRTRF